MTRPLEEMTMVQLRAQAKRQGVRLSSRMRKAEMIRALKKALQTNDLPTKKSAKPTKSPAASPRLAASPSPVRSSAPVREPRRRPEAEPALAAAETAYSPTELREAYGTDMIALLPRDPDFAFSYWEATERALEAAYASLGERAPDARLTLRVIRLKHDPSAEGGGIGQLDIEVYQRIGSWSLELRQPGAEFIVLLGVKSRDGRFFEIARSAPMKLPRAKVSDRLAREEDEAEAEELFALSGGTRLWSLSSAAGREEEAARRREGWGWITSPGFRRSGGLRP